MTSLGGGFQFGKLACLFGLAIFLEKDTMLQIFVVSRRNECRAVEHPLHVPFDLLPLFMFLNLGIDPSL